MNILEEAASIFAQAISLVKSQHYPYPLRKFEKLWILEDRPERRNARKTEVVSLVTDPIETVASVQRAQLGWHYLCDIQPSQHDYSDRRIVFKKLGYRAVSTEWVFIHLLDQIPIRDSVPPVKEIFTQEEADGVPQLSRHKLKLMNGARDFRIWDDQVDYGWVRSIDVGNSAWVSGLYVREGYRRKGYGGALMSALLRSDVEHERTMSVLTASRSGSMLYPQLGYREIGVLQMFCPIRDSFLASR